MRDHLSAGVAATIDVVSELDGTDLATVLEVAELQTRVDRKYILAPAQLRALAAVLPASFHALQIGNRRVFNYESVYFDTPHLRLFRDHVQGRRLRYKARTRTYLDSAETMFEVKLKGHRGRTVKHRMAYPIADRARVNAAAARFVHDCLLDEYGVRGSALQPVLTTAYSRSTLVDLDRGDRLTCDTDLTFSRGPYRVRGQDDVVVETKSPGGGGVADRLLRELRVQPVSMSKYCIGLAMLDPDLPSNRWHRVLRRHFAQGGGAVAV